MNVSPAKENILKKIRKALTHSTPLPFPEAEGTAPVFPSSKQELEIEFAEQFTNLAGKFVFCANRVELSQQLYNLVNGKQWARVFCNETSIRSIVGQHGYELPYTDSIPECEAAITLCEALVARTGSIVLTAAQPGGRTASVYAPVHVCIATVSQLVYEIKDALQLVRNRYAGRLPSLVTFATGPSRTADIEKTLVVGVHGPGEVYCFLVDEAL